MDIDLLSKKHKFSSEELLILRIISIIEFNEKFTYDELLSGFIKIHTNHDKKGGKSA
jgi:hypothetical protein